MNVEDHYRDFVKAFGGASVLSKILLVLFFFLSVSSITSLADIVFEWKGFILTALEFYRNYFVDPLTNLAAQVGLDYSRPEINAAVLASISVSVGMRLLSQGQIAAFRIINERHGSELKPDLRLYWAISIGLPTAIWIWYGLTEATIRPWVIGPIFLFYPVFLVAPKFIMTKFGYEYFEKSEFSYFKGYYAYVFALLIVVGTLGALNSGLQR